MSLRSITIRQLFKERVELTPDACALKDDNKAYTWLQVSEGAQKYCKHFLSKGIRPNDRVILAGRNSIEWFLSFYGLMLLGAVAVPCNPRYKSFELQDILDLLGSKYVVYDHYATIDDAVVKLMATRKEFRFIRMCGFRSSDDVVADDEAECLKDLKEDPHNVACILMTSGTTGKPKGVQLTHYNLVNNAFAMVKYLGWTCNDRMVLTSPLFHCFGLTQALLTSAATGFRIFVIPDFSSRRMLESIEKEKITILSGVPSMYNIVMSHNDLSQFDLTSIKSGIIAGSPISVNEYEEIVKNFGFERLFQSYGQTETSPAVTITDAGLPFEKRASSVGRAMEHVSVRIVDDCGKELKNNCAGSIEVKGYNVMYGYVGDDRIYGMDDWLSTGDMGYLDDDDCLHIVGRNKDIIIRGGENISAVEIESTVKEIDSINEVKAMAVKDKVMGEEIALILSIKNGKTCTEDDIRAYLSSKLAKHKVPRYIFIIDDLPKNDCGKIDGVILNKNIVSMVERKTLIKEESKCPKNC